MPMQIDTIMTITIYPDHSNDDDQNHSNNDDGDGHDNGGEGKRFRHDFRHGNGVKFKCVASIYDAYYKVTSAMLIVSKAMQLMMVMMVVFLRLVC